MVHTPWADLPLWEEVVEHLPTKDLLSLRQAWRAASQLGGARLRAEAAALLTKELADFVVLSRGGVVCTAIQGVQQIREMAYQIGDVDLLTGIDGFLTGCMSGLGAEGTHWIFDFVNTVPLAGGAGFRSTFQARPRGSAILLQAVVTGMLVAGGRNVELEFEELRFLDLDGSLIAEYMFAWSMAAERSVRALRLGGGGGGFGRLQERPLSAAPEHFAALSAAAAGQPLHTPGGRWSEGLLLPAIHEAVISLYPLQAS